MEWTKETPKKPGFYWIYTKDWEDRKALLRGGYVEMVKLLHPTYGFCHNTAGGVIYFGNVAYWMGPIEPPKPPLEAILDEGNFVLVQKDVKQC